MHKYNSDVFIVAGEQRLHFYTAKRTSAIYYRFFHLHPRLEFVFFRGLGTYVKAVAEDHSTNANHLGLRHRDAKHGKRQWRRTYAQTV